MSTARSRRPILIAMGIAAILAFSVTTGLSESDETQNFLYSPIIKTGHRSITHVEMRLVDGVVILNISLEDPLSCQEIYKQLGIEPLPINKKVYVPTCSVINPSFVQIHFKESITI